MNKIVLFTLTILSSQLALAYDGEAASGGNGLFALAAAFAIAVAALGGTLGQAKVGASAMEGIARNPQAQKTMFVPMIISLALIESLVIYALVIAFQLTGKA